MKKYGSLSGFKTGEIADIEIKSAEGVKKSKT
jgi:hypothetical protein